MKPINVDHDGNPWGLTQGQALALEAYALAGFDADEAARLAGKSLKTLTTQRQDAKIVMNARTVWQAVLMWDRWAR